MTDEANQEGAPTSADGEDRRGFLKNASRVAMAAGLVGGYGGFALVAGRYLYPAELDEVIWQFVTEADGVAVGESIRYLGPSGETINITRRARNGDADDFIALSSTCPHLGCQVRWEEQNNQFFCPCHNGVFDPSGKAIAGPPGEAGQFLPRHQIKVEGGNLHIAVPPPLLANAGESDGVIDHDECISGPGHDPCLGRRVRRGAADASA
jgi:Rieske Fe-S protein